MEGGAATQGVRGLIRRKMLAAREDLVARTSEIANRKGLTLYGLVNEALDSIIKMEDQGITSTKIMEAHQSLEADRGAGFTLCPENLWYEMVEAACQNGRDRVADQWFEAGARCAKLHAVRQTKDPLAVLTRDIRTFASNPPGFDVLRENGDRDIGVRCLSPKFSESYATLFGRFLEGAFTTFGYRLVERDVAKGAVQLKLTRPG